MSQEKLWGCVIAAGFSFNALFAQPIIVQQPESRIAAEGKTVEFSVEAQSSSPLNYQCQFDGADIPNAVGHAIRFTATLSRAGTYSVNVSDGSGAANASADLEVQKRPVIIQQPKHQVVGQYQTAVFEVLLNDSGPWWYMNWWHHSPEEPHHPIPPSAVPTSQQLRMEIPDCTPNGTYNGLYWFAVTNDVGGTVSRRASLVVVGPPQFTSEPQDRTVRTGGSASFHVGVAPDAGGVKTKQWYFNDQPIAGATQSTLNLSHVQPEQQGVYTCVVTGIGGSSTSYGAILTVY